MAAVINETMVHVRFRGRSWDLSQRDLDLTPECAEADVKRAVARYLDVSARDLGNYVVEREPSGHFTIRPEAVFG